MTAISVGMTDADDCVENSSCCSIMFIATGTVSVIRAPISKSFDFNATIEMQQNESNEWTLGFHDEIKSV